MPKQVRNLHFQPTRYIQFCTATEAICGVIPGIVPYPMYVAWQLTLTDRTGLVHKIGKVGQIDI